MRATEEVQLLKEEMRHVRAFCTWKAAWWRTRACLRKVDAVLAEGSVAYSKDQAIIQEALEAEFGLLWDTPLDSQQDSSNKIEANTNDNDGEDNDNDTDYEEGINGGDYNDDDDDVKEVPDGYLG